MPLHIKLSDEEADQFEEIKHQLEEEHGNPPTNSEIVGELMSSYEEAGRSSIDQ